MSKHEKRLASDILESLTLENLMAHKVDSGEPRMPVGITCDSDHFEAVKAKLQEITKQAGWPSPCGENLWGLEVVEVPSQVVPFLIWTHLSGYLFYLNRGDA
jgi:hypothetical protein